MSAVLAATALSTAFVLFFMDGATARRATCAGKKATIASSEKKIVGTKAPDVIVAGRGGDVIFGAGGNDRICGGPGRDLIHGQRGNDRLRGGQGQDRLYAGRGSDDANGDAGRDRVFGETGNDTIAGGPGRRDNADGGPGDDAVRGGGGGFDVVYGGVGRDRIDGGPGQHDVASYRGAGGSLVVDLGSGSVTGAEAERLRRIEDVLGGSGDDALAGAGATANRIDGGPGEDRLLAGSGGDAAFGGPGSDLCVGPFAAESSCGPTASAPGASADLYQSIAGSASLVVTGSGGPDAVTVLRGRRGYRVTGASGGGLLRGPVSSILVSLGDGDDAFAIHGRLPRGVQATLDGGPGSDRLRGGPGADTIYAGDDRQPDELRGAGGNDVLFGVNILHPRRSSGAARMLGGAGGDLLVGGQPCEGDRFDGGRGENDSASFARVRNAGVVVRATIGGAVVDPGRPSGCSRGAVRGDVEKIEGSPGRDMLFGSRGADVLLGRGGNDRLRGRGGADRCVGGGGGDRIRGCERAW